MSANVWLLGALMCSSLVAAPQRRGGFMSVMARSGEWWAYFNAVCEPAPKPADARACAPGHSGGIGPGSNGMMQYTMADRISGTWFGYAIDLARGTQTDTVRLQFKPATSEGYKGLREMRLPLDPTPFEVGEGDIVRLPLLVNPSTGTRLISEIQVYSREMSWSEVLGEDVWNDREPSDFTFEKVPFRLEKSVVLVDGKEVAQLGGVTSHVVDFRLPGANRFVFSMSPEPELGFEKRGVVRGRSMLFRVGESEYEWRSTERILPGSGTFNLYVFVDSSPRAIGARGFGTAGWRDAESSVRNR